MPEADPPVSAKRARPQIGKDHLNLADWPISIPRFQQPRKKDGGKVDYVEYVVSRADGTAQSVSLEASSKTGLPTAGDEDVLIALLALAKEQEFESDVVRFIPGRLLTLMGWPAKQASYERLIKAIKRLRAVTLTYRLAWYDRTKAAVEPVLITGILAEAKVVLRRGRRAANAVPDSYVQWTQNFYSSIRAGNLTDLDLDLYFSWKRPVAKQLHRHLNKVWHSGRKPKPYERDLRDLACGHLGMTQSKDLKRNFHEVVKELEERSYLVPMDPALRYRKVRPGVWRVRLEIHPAQLRRKSGRAGESPKPVAHAPAQNNAPARLVREYHRHRFARDHYIPKSRELHHASELLRSADADRLMQVIPEVAKAVERQYRGEDCHFGAAVPHFELVLSNREAKDRCRARERAEAAHRCQTRAEMDSRREEQRQIRTTRLNQWRQLPTSEKKQLYKQAIAHAASNAVRTRLRRQRSNEDPPTEVLALLDSLPASATGESS